jgi:hypothetical protein
MRVWRGPFKAVRHGRGWKVVNRRGEDERVGFVTKGACDEVARLKNLAAQDCDELDEPPPPDPGTGGGGGGDA